MKMWDIYTTDYSKAVRNDAIMQYAATWIELEDIMLNEVSHKTKDE